MLVFPGIGAWRVQELVNGKTLHAPQRRPLVCHQEVLTIRNPATDSLMVSLPCFGIRAAKSQATLLLVLASMHT